MSVIKSIRTEQTYATLANDSLDAVIGSYYLPDGSLDTDGRLTYTSVYNHVLKLRKIGPDEYIDIYPYEIIKDIQTKFTNISYEDSLYYITFSIDISSKPTVYIPVLGTRIVAGILRYYIIDYDNKESSIDKAIIERYYNGANLKEGRLKGTESVYVSVVGNVLYVIAKYIKDTENFILTATSSKSIVRSDVPLHTTMIRKYSDSDEDLTFYVNSSTDELVKSGSYAIVNADEVSLDLVLTSSIGNSSDADKIPDGPHKIYKGTYNLDILSVVKKIMDQEHYLRSISIDYKLSSSEIRSILNYLKENKEIHKIDNYEHLLIISTCDDTTINDERFINVGTEILDTELDVQSSSVSVFYSVVKSLMPISYDSVLINHISDNPNSMKLITDDTSIRNYHYNSDELDNALINLIKSTIVANILKRIDLFLAGDYPAPISLIDSPTVEVVTYEVKEMNDVLNINLQVSYNHIIENINFTLNYNNYV